MKKIRCSLATIALLLSLSGISLFQEMGSASLANAASSHHVSSASALSVIVNPVAVPKWPCGGTNDC